MATLKDWSEISEDDRAQFNHEVNGLQKIYLWAGIKEQKGWR